MQIIVRVLMGHVITLEVEPCDTIEHVLELIRINKVPLPSLRLFLGCTKLKISRTLSDYNIQEGRVLQLLFDITDCIWVFVKTKFGETMALSVKSTDSIENVKAKIRAHDPVLPRLKLDLVYDGTNLEDFFTLKYFDIEDESILHVGFTEQRKFISSNDEVLKDLYFL